MIHGGIITQKFLKEDPLRTFFMRLSIHRTLLFRGC
jgi:hypothetical protein